MLIQVKKKKKGAQIVLARVQESDSKKCWIFTFLDAEHKLMQSVIYAKSFPGDAMEGIWEQLHEKWGERIREAEWKSGNADLA